MPPSEGDPQSSLRRDEPRNLWALILNSLLIRVGWIFKIESVIIPAFLDSIAGAGWMRGLLPILNRLGQSVPPFFLATRLKLMPQKAPALLFATLGMALTFLCMAAVLALSISPEGAPPAWFAYFFLTLYALFFSATGVYGMVVGTLQGKLIRANRRGRLLALSTVGGTVPAIVLAVWLLPYWLEAGMAGWVRIFAMTGACFAIAGVPCLLLREPRDAYSERRQNVAAQLRGALSILKSERDYRRIVVIGVLYMVSLMLLPHYQALARERLGLGGGELMFWVVAQSAATAAGSALIGPLADRLGNRLTLALVLAISVLVPPGALFVSTLEPEQGRLLFPLVFIGVGTTPLGLRLIANYILEVTPESEHPRRLSLAQVCTAAVLLTSPGVGWAVDRVGYDPVFVVVTVLIAIAALRCLALREPRWDERHRPVVP